MRKQFLIALVLTVCTALSTSAFSADKIGSINMRKLFFDYKKTKDFNKTLEGKDAEAKEEIEKRSEAIRKLRDEIDLLSDDAREKRQPELRDAITKLDDYRKEKAESFVREKDEMFREVREDIVYAASEYAKKNKYDMVLDGSVFVYSSEGYDITDNILKELNKK